MSHLTDVLQQQLRGPRPFSALIFNRQPLHRQIIQMLLMADEGGTVVYHTPKYADAMRAHAMTATVCEVLGLTFFSYRPDLCIRFGDKGMIMFIPSTTNPEKIMGLELAGVFIHETT